jgi:hypothetical protein
MTQPDRISANPDPVHAGGNLEICYSFTGTGLNMAKLTIAYADPTPADSATVTPSNPCKTVKVPTTATGDIIISGPQSADHPVTIT